MEISKYIVLYLSIILASILSVSSKKWLYLLGSFLVGICLLPFEFRDISEYRDHYNLASTVGFESLLSTANFEIGYVLLVIIASKLIPFNIFYVSIIAFAIYTAINFYHKYADHKSQFYVVLFLSVFLYFIAFTLRTTIASAFLAIALCKMKERRIFFASIIILLAASFHLAVLPFLIFPIVNYFTYLSKTKRALFLSIFLLITLFHKYLLNIFFIYFPYDFILFKLNAYEDSNVFQMSTYLLILVGIFILYIPRFKLINIFDKYLLIGMGIIVTTFIQYSFFLGRIFWASSFISAYFLSKTIFSNKITTLNLKLITLFLISTYIFWGNL